MSCVYVTCYTFITCYVGMTWKEAEARCPKGVVPACYNNAGNVTVSGSADLVSSFVDQLQTKEIFARNVDSNEIAFDSYVMKLLAPAL